MINEWWVVRCIYSKMYLYKEPFVKKTAQQKHQKGGSL